MVESCVLFLRERKKKEGERTIYENNEESIGAIAVSMHAADRFAGNRYGGRHLF